jgi:hypothetical protein
MPASHRRPDVAAGRPRVVPVRGQPAHDVPADPATPTDNHYVAAATKLRVPGCE